MAYQTSLEGVEISEDVVKKIAGLATIKSEGISSMSGGIVDGIAERLGRRNLAQGVRAQISEQEVYIDLNVIIKGGYKIPEVAQRVQKNVKDAIENMTGLKATNINVHTEGISEEEENFES